VSSSTSPAPIFRKGLPSGVVNADKRASPTLMIASVGEPPLTTQWMMYVPSSVNAPSASTVKDAVAAVLSTTGSGPVPPAVEPSGRPTSSQL
jgi:hypothetical protein